MVFALSVNGSASRVKMGSLLRAAQCQPWIKTYTNSCCNLDLELSCPFSKEKASQRIFIFHNTADKFIFIQTLDDIF